LTITQDSTSGIDHILNLPEQFDADLIGVLVIKRTCGVRQSSRFMTSTPIRSASNCSGRFRI